MKETGMKRRPVSEKLSVDFVHSILYYTIDSAAICGVKLVQNCVVKRRPKQSDATSPFAHDQSMQI